jgi:hypothetical protein
VNCDGLSLHALLIDQKQHERRSVRSPHLHAQFLNPFILPWTRSPQPELPRVREGTISLEPA